MNYIGERIQTQHVINLTELESTKGITIKEARWIIRAGKYSLTQKEIIFQRYINTIPPEKQQALVCTFCDRRGAHAMFLDWEEQNHEDRLNDVGGRESTVIFPRPIMGLHSHGWIYTSLLYSYM
jgi:hypothetical protein